MKQIFMKTTALLAGLLVSGAVSAHAGVHGAEGLIAGVRHLLAEHGYLLVIVAAGLGSVVLKRSSRA